MAIDRPSGRLYWNDANQKTIESSDLEGHDRRIIITDVKHPYGLVVVGNHMYWTDWQTESVHRADKINGSDRTTIRDKLDGLMDIRSIQVVSNLCKIICLAKHFFSFRRKILLKMLVEPIMGDARIYVYEIQSRILVRVQRVSYTSQITLMNVKCNHLHICYLQHDHR